MGLTSAPSNSQRPSISDGLEDAGQRVGRAHGVDELAARQPDLVAGADLGGDRNEALVQGLDGDALEARFAGCR